MSQTKRLSPGLVSGRRAGGSEVSLLVQSTILRPLESRKVSVTGPVSFSDSQ